MTVKIVSDHGFPKGDGSLPTDDPFSRFKNERDYVAQSGRNKTTVAAMDWAASEIDRLTAALSDQAGGWQDISTAPRDGSRILATGGGLGHEIEIVNYNERVGCWDAPNDTLDDCDDEPQGYSRPTHWQPLPVPPPSSTAGEVGS